MPTLCRSALRRLDVGRNSQLAGAPPLRLHPAGLPSCMSPVSRQSVFDVIDPYPSVPQYSTSNGFPQQEHFSQVLAIRSPVTPL